MRWLRHQIFLTSEGVGLQLGIQMALLAESFCVACLAFSCKRAKPSQITMVACEARALMVNRKKRCEICVARFTGVCCLLVVVACVTGCHRRHVGCGHHLHLVNSNVTGGALDAFHRTVLFMGEKNLAPRSRNDRNVRRIIVAVAAFGLVRVVHLLFVACHARVVSGNKVVRRELARFCRRVADCAISHSHFRYVVLVREGDGAGSLIKNLRGRASGSQRGLVGQEDDTTPDCKRDYKNYVSAYHGNFLFNHSIATKNQRTRTRVFVAELFQS
jgi:hypothetical protein